jgi:N-acetylmuramoyl-L-alanine amidase
MLIAKERLIDVNKQSPVVRHVQPPYRKEVIVIDPGHGGKDPGARSLGKPTVLEKRLTLACSQIVKHSLETLGYKPLLTRKSDHSLTLSDRVEFCQANQPDIFVSIHFNSAPNCSAEGIEIFYFPSRQDPKRAKLSEELAQATLRRSIEWTGAENRRVKKGDYYVIRENDVPAILIEGGFLTNDHELAKLKNPHYLKRLGLGIAKGIDDYLTSHRKRPKHNVAKK